jgi:hypothetical protein
MKLGTMEVTLKKYKKTRGMEGPGFTATVLVDGAPVVDVADWGDGGGTNEQHVHDREKLELLAAEAIKANPSPPKHKEYERQFALETLYDKLATNEQLKKWCQRSILATKPGLRPGEYVRIMLPPTPQNIERVKKENPELTILNGTL